MTDRKKSGAQDGDERLALSRRGLLRTVGQAGAAGLAAHVAMGTSGNAAEPPASDQRVSPAAGQPGSVKTAPAGAPNVVVILLDDAGFADFGCYGSEIETPAIDRLAKNGALYTNFHTAAVCSATRASLMTGLNPHSAGIGWLADVDRGLPGYRGDLTLNAATLAELLRANGYSTYHSGKWHLNYSGTDSPVGPVHNWPTQRGFDRSYWFHGHSTDYFHPAELFDGNSPVTAPRSPDYYISDDLTDRAINFVRTHRAVAPDRPFFLYLAFSAPHSPVQARAEDRDRYSGRYEMGWDALRDARLARQKELGVVPAATELSPRDLGVPAWDSLGADERKLFARYMEVYAGCIHRVDWNIGRLVAALETLGQLDGTLLVISSDNGASMEGTLNGTPNLYASASGGLSTQEALTLFDVMGEAETFPHYPIGWAIASNTPFRMFKQFTFLGGIADPLVVHWPKGIGAPGSIRRQYGHVSDLFPTIADVVGAKPLKTLEGRTLKPVEGTSLAETLAKVDAPDRHREQFYELSGHRAMYADGWHIVTLHRSGRPFEDDVWELYDKRVDINERNNLAKEHPERVAELERKWHAAARRFNALPMDPRSVREKSMKEWSKHARAHWEIIPPVDMILHHAAPPMLGNTHSITAEIDRARSGDGGIIAAFGTVHMGFVLYIRGGRLVYEANMTPKGIKIEAEGRLPIGPCTVKYVQTMSERPYKGTGALYVDGQKKAGLVLGPAFFGRPYQGLQIGRNDFGPVSRTFKSPLDFSGTIKKVIIDCDPSPMTDEEIARIGAVAQIRI